MSKGSKQRPGKGYADNWDVIFKKPEPCEHYWVGFCLTTHPPQNVWQCSKCGERSDQARREQQEREQARPYERRKFEGD